MQVEKSLRQKVNLGSAMLSVFEYCAVATHPQTAPSMLQFLTQGASGALDSAVDGEETE